ncbi:MAG TPA: hypothetical protein VFW07_23330 [Parafilimonas sp.]|nr:hypothetical protein [Parafilimonas sp.]
MIVLLGRNDILKLNKTFASFIINWQEQAYNPALEHNRYQAGTMYDVHINKLRYYSQEEVDRINEERLEAYNREKDTMETIPIEDKYIKTLIYNFPYAPIENYTENLAAGILTLAEQLNWEAVLFLLVYPMPWLGQTNEYAPVKKALNYLKSIGVTDDFTGGIIANGADLEELLKYLFWICRCNAALPYCFFSGIETAFAGNICQYGNIHLHFYSETEMIKIRRAAYDLHMIEIRKCFENFSETGAIEGRRPVPVKRIAKRRTKPWWKFW